MTLAGELITDTLPLAAGGEVFHWPAFSQTMFTPTVTATLIVLGLAVLAVAYMSRRAQLRKREENRREALRMAAKIILKRGGTDQDAETVVRILEENSQIDPGEVIMLKDKFRDHFLPALAVGCGIEFGERMQEIFFPPIKKTRVAAALPAAESAGEDGKAELAERQLNIGNQTPAGLLDLMDATLRPGAILRLSFFDIQGAHPCLVMGHDMQGINVTLPANNPKLVSSLDPGVAVEGSMESGSSLIAFTSQVMQAVAGNMPYCRISAWSAAWEVRKRESVRLNLSVDLDFQHISTASNDTIRVSNLNNSVGAIRPGRLMDISLGGCCLETLSSGVFRVGDMIRYSHSLIEGTPPATLLGSVVKVDGLDPQQNNGAQQRLHIQFLVIDDVSQRLLFKAIKHLQDESEKKEWIKAQNLAQKMRHNNIPAIGSPAPRPGHPTTRPSVGKPDNPRRGNTDRAGTRMIKKPSTRNLPKTPPKT